MPSVLISSPHPNPWYRQFPNGRPEWNGWRFFFNDAGSNKYDYLVAFDDLHAPIVPKCPLENTVHISTEPVSVHHYDKHFTDQFGMCLTIDPDISHPNVIWTQPGLNWFIGWDPSKGDAPGALSFHDIEALFDKPRSKLISVIASNKAFTDDHQQRLTFAQNLKAHFGDQLDFFGRGFAPMVDKLDALKNYRFHIVLENTSLDHYFSEKLADCIMAGAYPLYRGCPNLESYLPADSFERIDILDLQGSIKIIEAAIAEDIDITNRDALREARKQIMYEHNLFAMLCRILGDHAKGRYGKTSPVVLYGGSLLPFNHEVYKQKFGPIKRPTVRQRLSRTADSFPPLGIVRKLYRVVMNHDAD